MRTFFALVVLVAASTAHAVPSLLQQQGRLLDSTDQPLTGSRSVTFSLYDDDTLGNLLWTEILEVSFTDGYFSVTLGQTNPIDEGVLANPEVWLGLTIASEELLPRQLVVSAPYALMAGTAENVVGGIVDATSIAVDGVPVVDDTGAWVGPPPPDTLSGLGCNAGDVPQMAAGGWTCVAGASLDTTLTEAQVEQYVTDGALDLATGTTLGGEEISVGPHTPATTSVDGLAGGTISSDVTVSGAVAANRLAASAGASIAGGLTLGNDSTACGPTRSGTLRHTATYGLEVCDGTAWVAAVSKPVIFSGGCTSHGTASAWNRYCLDGLDFNNATEYFTVAADGTVAFLKAGYYRINFWCISSVATWAHIRFDRNGITFHYGHEHANNIWSDNFADVVWRFNAGDTFSAWVYNSGGTSYAYHSWSASGGHSRLQLSFAGAL